MKLSIIVPVYNVPEYLPRCIDSLLRQGLAPDEYEIILVDDGSTDASGAICDQYAGEHAHIRVIHKENGGASDARNIGMRQASGSYIAFADSDDFLKDNSLVKLMQEAQRNSMDVVIGNALMYYTDGTMAPKIKKRESSYFIGQGKKILADSIKHATYTVCPVLGVYKKKFLLDNDLFFYSGIVCEDALWTTQVYIKANHMQYIDMDFYCYCYREGSVTQRPDKYDFSISILKIIEQFSVWIQPIELSSEERCWINDYMCTLYLNGFYVGKCYRRGRRGYIDRKLPIRLAHSRKNKVKALLFAISPTTYYLINKTTKMLSKTH